jgi:glutamate/tyrosine decarboxylase-like PLP-dependent enzyme
MIFPKQGSSHDDVIARINAALSGDLDWRGGKIWSLVYFAGDDVARVIRDAYSTAIYTNGLGPTAFKSLKRLESEVIAMTGELLGLPEAVGNMTSGGTESILMALKTARDWARAEKGITEPEVVLPTTAHPAFHKAAQYLGLKIVLTPIRDDYRADVDAVRAAITASTVLVVGSAPCYPFGTIDDIPALAAAARERGVPMHVDACVGGFLLPFVERHGYKVPPWDFRVPGVASISADLHKYGFAARGASTIMYRDRTYRKHQFFTMSDWPGGLYGSPTLAGSRPGGAVAASWAVMTYLGEEGYMRLAKVIMETALSIRRGIEALPGLRIFGDPDVSLMAFGSDELDIYAVGDALDQLDWHPDRQQAPPSLHLMVTPAHQPIVEPFLAAVRQAVESVRAGEVVSGGTAAMYGAAAKIPDRGAVRSFIADAVEGFTRLDKTP